MSMFNIFNTTRRNPWEQARAFKETDPLASRRIGQEEDELGRPAPRQEERLTPEAVPDQFTGERPLTEDPGVQMQRESIEQMGSRATNLESQLASATAAQRAREAASRASRGGGRRTGTRIVDAQGNVVDPGSLQGGARVFAGTQEQYQAQRAAMGNRAPQVVGTFRNSNGQMMPVTQTSTSSAARKAVLETARGFLGSPYRLGGTTVDGIDCSGLVMIAYRNAGINVEHHSASWQRDNIPGTRTSINNLEPGDLVAWDNGKHIAIYAGNGNIIDASSSGGTRHRPLWTTKGVVGIRVNFPGDY
jgi:cell wall-associated NlpC family hydrolase